ncbi:MAG: hypothetical protein AAFN92_04150, partial [Bacteroidota bacterium]
DRHVRFAAARILRGWPRRDVVAALGRAAQQHAELAPLYAHLERQLAAAEAGVLGDEPTDDEAELLERDDRTAADRAAWVGYFLTNSVAVLNHFDALHRIDLVKAYLSTPFQDAEGLGAEETTRQDLVAANNPLTVDAAAFWTAHRDTILAWYALNHENGVQEESILHTLLRVEIQLDEWEDAGMHIQTQALSGFNEALLMLHESLQLEVAEPNGPPEYAAFSQRVAAAVGRLNQMTGRSNLLFHPLRTGDMTLMRLRLVDTYGRAVTVIDQTSSNDSLPVAVPERILGTGGTLRLPPRISQPARLNLRWLSADENEVEANDHPFTTPICGWVMANHLDESLDFYHATGEALGSIDQTGKWRVFPSHRNPLLLEDIPNAYLRKMARWIQAHHRKADRTISSLLDEWEKVLEGIDPAGFTQHQSRALLMGRPLALVEVKVDLELKHWPAVHQDWQHFQNVLQGAPYATDNFEHVRVPVRIGEHQRLNDGVVSYWLDEGLHFSEEMYSPRGKLTFTQSIAAPPQRVAVLFDPRGSLHCTTGILPTKAITIPREQYAAAMEKIEIAFLTAPVISPPRQVQLYLPEVSGFGWSWLQQTDLAWTELTQRPVLRKSEVVQALTDGEAVWRRLVNKGWVIPLPTQPDQAYLVEVDERDQADLTEAEDAPEIRRQWLEKQAGIEQILLSWSRSLHPPALNNNLSVAQEIREGYLALRPTTIE